MRKKKIILGMVVAICTVVLVFQVANEEKDSRDRKKSVNQTKEQNSNEAEKNSEKNRRKDQNTAAKNKDVGRKDPLTKKQTTEAKAEKDTTETNRGIDTENETDVEKGTGEKDGKTEGVKFPYEIPEQGITVETIRGYDGIYVEDGNDEKVKKVAAILVTNQSKKGIEYGSIAMETGENTLEFQFSVLPAGKSCIVMEKNKTTYKKKWEVQSVKGDFAYVDDFSKLKSEIAVTTIKNNGICIANKTDTAIPQVRIFYKYQMDSGEYIGGITYNCKVDNLEVGEKRKIYPSHFSFDGSVILMVRRYEKEE